MVKCYICNQPAIASVKQVDERVSRPVCYNCLCNFTTYLHKAEDIYQIGHSKLSLDDKEQAIHEILWGD